MRLQRFQILLLGLILSCSSPLKRDKEELRICYTFYQDSLVKHQSYKLLIAHYGAIISYKYFNQIDSSKNMTFKYNIKSDVLIYSNLEMEKTKANFVKIDELASSVFDLYELKIPITDGWGSIMFSQDYGILNIGDQFKPYQNLFLPTNQPEAQISQLVWGKYRNQ